MTFLGSVCLLLVIRESHCQSLKIVLGQQISQRSFKKIEGSILGIQSPRLGVCLRIKFVWYLVCLYFVAVFYVSVWIVTGLFYFNDPGAEIARACC